MITLHYWSEHRTDSILKTNSHWASLLKLFSEHELDFEEARKRLLFGVFGVCASLMMFAFCVFHVSHGHVVEGSLNGVAGIILLSSVWLVRGYEHAASFYRIPGIVIGLLFIYFATLGQADGYRMLWMYAYPPMVLFLVGAREGMLYVGLVTMAWVVALVVPGPVSGFAVYDPAMTMRFLPSFALVIGASWFLESVRRHYADSERAHTHKLERDRLHMHDLAYSDDLTQLPNRRSALHMVDDTLAALSFDDSKTALIAMMDIDRFKVINDHFGHPVGDEVLKSVAKRVRSAVRANDFVGRFGGEEFLFVIPGALPEKQEIILEKIRLAVCKRPISLEGVLHHVTVSVGGTNVDLEFTRDALIAQADEALYVAKSSGRNCSVMYRQGLHQKDATVTIAS